jgi:hypothetical protein
MGDDQISPDYITVASFKVETSEDIVIKKLALVKLVKT